MPITEIYQHKVVKYVVSLLSYGIVFIVVYSLINWWRQPVMPTQSNLQFITTQNQIIDLANMSQKQPVLVYFWGSWCGVCRRTSPNVSDLAKDTKYPVVSVAVMSGSNAEVTQYLDKHQWQWVTINDEDGKLFAQWQGKVTPSFVILKDGKLVHGLTGYHPTWELKLRLWLIDRT